MQEVCGVVQFMWRRAIHVVSCNSCGVVRFMWCRAIHVVSCGVMQCSGRSEQVECIPIEETAF